MTISRRKFLGWIGAAGASTTLGKPVQAASPKQFPGHPGSNVVLILDAVQVSQVVPIAPVQDGVKRGAAPGVLNSSGPERGVEDIGRRGIEIDEPGRLAYGERDGRVIDRNGEDAAVDRHFLPLSG